MVTDPVVVTFASPLPYEDTLHAAVVRAGYTSRATLIFDESYYLWVLWRPDSPDAEHLETAMRNASRQSHGT